MKEKLKNFAAACGRVCCTIVGLAIAGYGISYFVPKKKYAGGDLEVKDIPASRIDEDVDVK